MTTPSAAPKKKSRLALYLIVFVLLCITCAGIALLASPSTNSETTKSSGTLVAGASTTAPQAANTPAPIEPPVYPGAGNYPTPRPDLLKEILKNKKEMTDMQFKEYTRSLIGTRIHVEGDVAQVYDDGRLQLNAKNSGLFDIVIIQDVPRDVLMKIPKTARMSVDATISDFTDFIAFEVTCKEPVVYWIK